LNNGGKLRLLHTYASDIASRGGVIFHGASLVSPDGCGILLCGPSGSGKSTVTEKLHTYGYDVINDEMAVVLPTVQNQYSLAPVPWMQAGVRECFVNGIPLTAIAILEHGKENLSDYQPLSFRVAITFLPKNIWYFPELVKIYPEFMRSIVLLAAHMSIGILRHALRDTAISDLIGHMERRDYGNS